MVGAVALFLFGLNQAPPLPVAYWLMQEARYQSGEIVSATGPNLMVSGFPAQVKVDGVTGYKLVHEGEAFVYPWDDRSQWPAMPKKDFTVSVQFALNNQAGVQGVVGCAFQPREGFAGWRVVVREGHPEFTLGKPQAGMVTIADKNKLSPEKLHRVDASYDGKEAKFFVDGILVGTQPASYGELVYNGRAGICFGDWWEGPRSFRYEGVLTRAALFNQALTPAEVDKGLAAQPVQPMPNTDQGEQKMVIAPFFQYPTPTGVTVVWETTRMSPSIVRYGLSSKTPQTVTGKPGRIHEVKLEGLKPSTTYFVQTESEGVKSEWESFRTGSLPGTPVKFAVVGDTQDHPEVNHEVGKAMFAERPDFAMIVGDLVGMGWKKEQWVHDFFGSLRPLFNHVPLIPVIGNHDRNARIYYDLMSVPSPEFYYRYRTGDVEIWVIDTNQDVRPGSEQYQWLEKTLPTSDAKWKIVAHHHPPYSSDEDDFGDTKFEPTVGGEWDIRPLCTLYDKYGVDLCFAGHIHSYERTYPLKAGKIVPDGKGTVYVVVGGGGGDLETAGPVRLSFSHTVRHGHHFGIVNADEKRLEFRAYDVEGRLFDSFELRK